MASENGLAEQGSGELAEYLGAEGGARMAFGVYCMCSAY